MANENAQPDNNGIPLHQKGKFSFLRRLRQPDEKKWENELDLKDNNAVAKATSSGADATTTGETAIEDDDIEVEIEDEPDATTPVRADVEQKCLSLLGLLEEFYSANSEDKQHLQRSVLLSDEGNLDALLKILEPKSEKIPEIPDLFAEPDTTLENPAETNFKQILQTKIAGLLADTQVKTRLFDILKSEGRNFKIAYPTMRKIARRKKVAELAPREIVRLYLRDKRTKGKLSETTKDAIRSLEKHRKTAKQEAENEYTKAKPATKGWLLAQELLEYKKQLKEKGFAKTESRKKLVECVLDGVAHGEKMFLVGSTGTGKTQLAMLVADLINEAGFEIVSWHEGTTPRDLFGYREIGTDENGKTKSGMKKGPVSIAISDGKIVIHDEYTSGTTRSQLAAKAQMNAKVGQKTHIPGFNGEFFNVEEGFGEIFTGNLQDEKTKAREHMDPAMLRMLSGLTVSYMPSDELFKVILAELMDEVGFLPLSKADVELIRRVTKAAELMQMCHDREVDKLNASPAKDVITNVFGGRLDEVHMDNNFFDTGTVLRIFQGWDLEQAKGKTFADFLNEKIQRFLEDPKSGIDRDEKKLAQTILQVCNVTKADGSLDAPVYENDSSYILPSRLTDVLKKGTSGVNPLTGTAPALPAAATAGHPTEVSDQHFIAHVDGLNLSVDHKNKIKEMMTYLNYTRALDAAKELDPTCKVPTKAQIAGELIKLSAERLKEICEIQEKPTLVIVPPNGFKAKVDYMDLNRHYIHAQGQNEAYVNTESNSPYTNAPRMTNGKVSIVDGVVHPKAPQGVSSKLKERRDFYTAIFMTKSAKHIDKDEYAALMQMSLIEATQANDNNKIIDNWESGSGTASFFDPATLTNSSLVAYGVFGSRGRRVGFFARDPDAGNDSLRGRSSVPFFEFAA